MEIGVVVVAKKIKSRWPLREKSKKDKGNYKEAETKGIAVSGFKIARKNKRKEEKEESGGFTIR